ncbi:MAG: class I SAM-dependent methyltransferase, partial [Deltaproteobacteria bacterium]|nr:class I SAM-dependent methyltransferase [Deltaproteobacteria bacterium]
MTLKATLLEKGLLPDFAIRYGIRRLNLVRLAEEGQGGEADRQARLMSWIDQMKNGPIALKTEAANAQHYEVPTEFFLKVLGPRLKYSSCYFEPGVTSLKRAEEAMLELYVERAQIADGQEILELGCGWGS